MMKKILIVGAPGSGKSTLAKRLGALLGYPLLHLDRIFHIDNQHQITRADLIAKIIAFRQNKDCYIIDGNYQATLPLRLEDADTVIYLNIDPELRLKNVMKRIGEDVIRDDIAEGFDNSVVDPEFIEYVKTFHLQRQADLEAILAASKALVIKINDYIALEQFITQLEIPNR